MVKQKSPQSLCLLFFSFLLPCVLFSTLVEYSRDIKELNVLSSVVSEGEKNETSGSALLISESFLFYSQPLTKTRTQFHRLWRQFLALIVLALFLKACCKNALQKYCLHHYFPREFFHGLLISFLLGGRAPPRLAWQFVAL
jgi:hypothetical protein